MKVTSEIDVVGLPDHKVILSSHEDDSLVKIESDTKCPTVRIADILKALELIRSIEL